MIFSDQIRQHLAAYGELKSIEFPTEAEALKEKKRAPGQSASSTVRVDTELLDRFINLTGELITNRYQLQSAAGEQDWTELNEGLNQLARLVKNLHHQVLQVRMMPLESVTGRLPRAVRELCRTTGKEVKLTVLGGSIELDRAILEELTDPLTHMLRNAIDHGIEQQGNVQIKAWREACVRGNQPQDKHLRREASYQQHKRKINMLERELKRKEKALAEMAALLVLRKKYDALWEEPEDD
jgi:two-component system chemotaxis sensor kinase CheA